MVSHASIRSMNMPFVSIWSMMQIIESNTLSDQPSGICIDALFFYCPTVPNMGWWCCWWPFLMKKKSKQFKTLQSTEGHYNTCIKIIWCLYKNRLTFLHSKYMFWSSAVAVVCADIVFAAIVPYMGQYPKCPIWGTTFSLWISIPFEHFIQKKINFFKRNTQHFDYPFSNGSR